MGSEYAVTPGSSPTRRLDARVRRMGGTVILAGPQTALELSDIALEIWLALDGRQTLAEVGHRLAAEYDIEAEEVIGDVIETVQTFVAARVVRLGTTSSSIP